MTSRRYQRLTSHRTQIAAAATATTESRETDASVCRRATRAGCCAWALITAFLIIVNPGCRATIYQAPQSTPRVTTRFSPTGQAGFAERQVVALGVQCPSTPTQIAFSQRLATSVARELELAQIPIQVQPWQPLWNDLLLPTAGRDSEVTTVSFTQAESVTPPPIALAQFQEPAPNPAAAESVDFVLQIQVLEYRPWNPMLATLRITVLNSSDLQPVFTTTASWTAAKGVVTGGCDPAAAVKPGWLMRWKLSRKTRRIEDEARWKPSPGHNSPEALMQIMSHDIAAWYESSFGVPVVVQPDPPGFFHHPFFTGKPAPN